jgi:hypothetical protein
MVFLIFILIVYGMSLIIVQGTIFENVKLKIKNYTDSSDEFFNPSEEFVVKAIDENNSAISKTYIKIYRQLFEKLKSIDSNSEEFHKIFRVWDKCKNKIKNELVTNRKKSNKFKYFIDWIIKKFYKIIMCMMCSPFWCSLIICILSLFFNISIFGFQISIVQNKFSFDTIISMFFVSVMSSGITWAINAVIDYFDEKKEYYKRKN